MKQPALGLVATTIVIALSLGFISLFDFETFAGWVSYCIICMVPMAIIVGVTWGANPPFVSRVSQPMRGLVLVAVCIASGAVSGPVYWRVVGGGLSPPAPMLVMCTIASVVILFWFAIMFGGWPFTSATKAPIAAGLLMWAACYAANYGLFRVFFNFSFMANTPAYAASLDPRGLFNATAALVFYVSAITVMFLLLHFDLWPLTTVPSLMKQPTLGIVWTVLALALGGLAYGLGVNVLGMDPMLFLVRVPVPFIFGTIVVLNMLHNSIFAALTQPAKGIANSLAAAILGLGLAFAFQALASRITGPLAFGPPGNDLERWIASALLGVTFPFLIFYADFFKMWPLAAPTKPNPADHAAAPATGGSVSRPNRQDGA